MGFSAGAFSGGTADGPHDEVEVDRDDLNARSFEKAANERHENGYLMAHLYEQAVNTVVVWGRFR